MIVDKVKYQIHKASGTLKQYRASLIEREIAKRYTLGAEIALTNDKDIKPTEYAEYQAYRAECKDLVDKEMAELEAALETEVSE